MVSVGGAGFGLLQGQEELQVTVRERDGMLGPHCAGTHGPRLQGTVCPKQLEPLGLELGLEVANGVGLWEAVLVPGFQQITVFEVDGLVSWVI
jgi:hypothetical protein